MEITWSEEGVLVEREENTGRSQGSRVNGNVMEGEKSSQPSSDQKVKASDEGVIKKVIAC